MYKRKKIKDNELSSLFSIYLLLSKKRKIQILLNFFTILVCGFAEFISLGAVIPFLGIILDPLIVWDKPYIQKISTILNITTPDQLIFPIGILFVLGIVFANGIRTFNIWFTYKLSAAIGTDLSSLAFQKTLHQPLITHLNRNTSSIVILLTSNVTKSTNAFRSLLQITSASIISLSILSLLLLVNFSVALTIFIIFGTIYFSIGFFVKKKLMFNSSSIVINNKKIIQLIQEGLGAIREILLRNNQLFFVRNHKKNDFALRNKQSESKFLISFSKYILEPIGISIIASIAIYMAILKYEPTSVITLLGAFALGSQKLLPSLQEVFRGWSTIKISSADLKALDNFLKSKTYESSVKTKPINFKETIQLRSISFGYGKKQPLILKGINLKINKGEKIGIIGPTGSGKSTLIDILLGLLEPNEGEILVDNINILDKKSSGKLNSWKSIVSHVPQDIYLSDSSIKENIAFGTPIQKINMQAVVDAAKKSNIHSFINKLPDRYETYVGERGLNLSGGQKQRIGIARSLYKKSQILILDEATSSLDNKTELLVMNAINNLDKDITLIMIAHRLTTLKACDRVITINKGKVISSQNPDKIV